MNGFISNIISRQVNIDNNIKPRLPGQFEPLNFEPASSTELISNQLKNIHQGTAEIINDAVIRPAMNTISDDISSSPGNVTKNTVASSIIPGKEKEAEITHPGIVRKKLLLSDEQLQENITVNDSSSSTSPGEEGNLRENSFMEDQPSLIKKAKKEQEENAQKKYVIQPSFVNTRHQIFKNITSGYSFSEGGGQINTSPVIKVSIGRIEVRAVPPANPVKVNRDTIQKPKMSLEAYLQKRNNR